MLVAGALGLGAQLTISPKSVNAAELSGSISLTDVGSTLAGATFNGIAENDHAGSGATWLTGDTDGDGDTDTADLTTGIINFTGAMNTTVAVPEPSCTVLLVMAIGCLSAVGAIDRCREF